MSTIVKNIHIFKNNKWTPIKRVYDGNTWKKMKGIFFEGEWYEIGVTCTVMPDGCAVNTGVHPRWDESSSYGTNNFGFNGIPAGQRYYYTGNFKYIGEQFNFWLSSVNYIIMNASDNRSRYHTNPSQKQGSSVRCVKDYTGTQPNGTILTNDYTDGDGNTYDAVVISEKLWTVENLYTTKYQNGSNIPNVTSGTDWRNLTTGAYCWYDNDYTTYGQYYGALYNWYAVDSGLVNNNGYRVPSNSDWAQLIDYLKGTNWCNDVEVTSNNVTQFLKSCRQVNHPIQPNTTTQNTTGKSVWFEINDVKYYPESDTDEFLIDYEIGDVIKMSKHGVEHLYINGEQVALSWYNGDPPIEYTITESVIIVTMYWSIV